MKRLIDVVLSISLVVTLLLSGCTSTHATSRFPQTTLRSRVSFNEHWRFAKGDAPNTANDLGYDKLKSLLLASAEQFSPDAAQLQPEEHASAPTPPYSAASFDDRSWRALNLPHDWAVDGPFQQDLPGETGKLPYAGVGWYRKHFTVTPNDLQKRTSIEIDGAMSYSVIWVNGRFVGGWPYGYASYSLDLTPYLHAGDNVVAIRLDNPDGSSRWYPGGGLYRNVWLTRTEPVHVGHWGTYVTTPTVSPEQATIAVKTTVCNQSNEPVNLLIQQAIYRANYEGQPVGAPLIAAEPQSSMVGPNATITDSQQLELKQPVLWQLKTPKRYVMVTTVRAGAKVVDEYQTPFGVRTIAFAKDNGFLLNGQRVPLQGVCDHHDLGPLGAALNTRALERQLQLLQEMGCNAIRTSHNPPAPELLELCDRMGMLVMDESFDAWDSGKRKEDYHVLFDDWHERDLRALIRRDRNHACVVLWSIGNELKEFRPNLSGGQDIAAGLTKIAHDEDPTRPTTFACNVVAAAYNGFQKTVDVFGFNYKPSEYGKFHNANPDVPVFGSETSSTISTRGEYFFPVSDDKSKGHENFQVSSYDLSAPPWATTPDAEFAGQDKFPFVAGEFVWTGFDYLGEPTPYNRDLSMLLNLIEPAEQQRLAKEVEALGKIQMPSRSSYFGILDLCGFKKDRFYLYQSRWRADLPMAHILPHWNWPNRVGQVTPVHVYTSGDEAELFLNGKSLGRKAKAPLTYRLRWDDVIYEPGELKVVAYRHGKPWAQDIVRTTGPAKKIDVAPDRDHIVADGKDLSFITIRIADDQSQTVPRSNNPLHVALSGPGEIVGVDNGDPTNHLAFNNPNHPAFNGLCLVIVRSLPGQAGRINVAVTSDGLVEGVACVRSAR